MKPLTCQLPACHQSQVRCHSPAHLGWGPACTGGSWVLGMGDSPEAPLGQTLGAWWHLRTLGRERVGLRGHCPGCPLPLTLPFSLTFLSHFYDPFCSPPLLHLLSSFLPLSYFPIFSPSLPTQLCQFNPPLLCLAFPGSRCQASNLPDFTPEELVWSSRCRKDIGTWPEGT